jgi:putative acetyltransferase
MNHESTAIRPETAADEKAIYDLTKAAFAPMPYAGGDEQDLVNRLRDRGALVLSLVAVQGEAIVGHVAFSPAFAQDGSAGWYALGPVAVAPPHQHQGVGGLLITAGLTQLKAWNAAGCILTGNPAYYTRFGFESCPDLAPSCEPAQYFMIVPLGNKKPTSIMAFHPLFYNEA